MVTSHPMSWCCSIIAPGTSRFPASFQFRTGGPGKRGTTAGWLVTCSAHLEYWPNGWFLLITIPFINRFIEIYFIDQKIAHLGYFYEWSVCKCLGCTPSPQPGRNIISSPTKHSSCSSPSLFSPDFYLWATTGLISTPHHDGLHSSPDRSRFPFSAVSSSVYLLI